MANDKKLEDTKQQLPEEIIEVSGVHVDFDDGDGNELDESIIEEFELEEDEEFEEDEDIDETLEPRPSRGKPVQYPTDKPNHFSKDRRHVNIPKKSDEKKNRVHAGSGKGKHNKKSNEE